MYALAATTALLDINKNFKNYFRFLLFYAYIEDFLKITVLLFK